MGQFATSLFRRPIAERSLLKGSIGLIEKEIKLARGRIGIQLLIPLEIFALAEPLGNSQVLFWGQTIDCGFDLFHAAHDLSLSLHDRMLRLAILQNCIK